MQELIEQIVDVIHSAKNENKNPKKVTVHLSYVDAFELLFFIDQMSVKGIDFTKDCFEQLNDLKTFMGIDCAFIKNDSATAVVVS